jgi:hypothetical protein
MVGHYIPFVIRMFIGLPLVKTIDVHYEIIVKYFKPHLTFSPNYFWFIQYMKNDNGMSNYS